MSVCSLTFPTAALPVKVRQEKADYKTDKHSMNGQQNRGWLPRLMCCAAISGHIVWVAPGQWHVAKQCGDHNAQERMARKRACKQTREIRRAPKQITEQKSSSGGEARQRQCDASAAGAAALPHHQLLEAGLHGSQPLLQGSRAGTHGLRHRPGRSTATVPCSTTGSRC